MPGWIAVDFDGTLAHYTNLAEQGDQLGEPIMPMVERIKMWLEDGLEVRIFTARQGQDELICDWLKAAGLPPLKITDRKDPYLLQIWDDRSIQVRHNTGQPIGGELTIRVL